MRPTRLLGIAVALVAIAATMNALAYRTAAVTNNTSFTISTTDTAALALAAAGTPDPGITTTIVANALSIAITDKMQPNSVYCFTSAFKVTNNAAAGQGIITFDATTFTNMPAGTTVVLFKSGGPLGCATALPASTLAVAATTDLDIQVTVGAASPTGVYTTPTIVINAHR